MTKSEWAAVDWTLSNTEIGVLLNRSEAAPRYQRTRRESPDDKLTDGSANNL